MGNQIGSNELANSEHVLVFALDDQQFAVILSAVDRVVRAVEITPLPEMPASILGVINYQGQIIPVIDLRRKFHLQSRDLDLDDRFIIAHTSHRCIALAVDSVLDIRPVAVREMILAGQVLCGAEYLRGLTKLENDLVIICDLANFLALDEERTLDATMPCSLTIGEAN